MPTPDFPSSSSFSSPPQSPSASPVGVAKDTQQQLEIAMVKKIVEQLKRISRHQTNDHEKASVFIPPEDLTIPLQDYIHLLVTLANLWVKDKFGCESTGIRCAVLAMEYLRRVRQHFNPRNIYGYFSAAFLLAMKFSEDDEILNTDYSKVSGFSLDAINTMECEFCEEIQWNFLITAEEFDSQLKVLE